jgi:IstB-like ATP binding protein
LTQLLILDDWGLSVLNPPERRDLLEILDDRHGRASTIVTSQTPVEHWHDIIGDPTLGDAILDRLVHNALGRVKTPTFNQRIEIPSRFRQFENQKCLRLLLGEDDRENNSAHFWRVHVFTQPGSKATVRPGADHFRSTSINGHLQSRTACLKSATCGLPHCKKNKGKPFTYQHEWTSARGRLGLADLFLIQGHGPR